MRLAASLLLSLLALAGCGLGPGKERKGSVELRVTRDFGRERIGTERVRRVREDTTVMRLLRRRFRVGTRYGGRFVQSIEGVEGKGASGRRDWFFFVNGVESDVGAADYEVSPADVVQWDYRRWDAGMRVPAIVGAFPQPFRGGVQGKRLPVRVECEDPGADACGEVKRRLLRLHVQASGAALGAPGASESIRVLVGRWNAVRSVRTARPIEQGPGKSGVFARFGSGGRSLDLLGPGGERVRSAPAGAGLVAALSPGKRQLVWLVTATDAAGVGRAAKVLDARELRDAYAVAAEPGGVERLPVERP